MTETSPARNNQLYKKLASAGVAATLCILTGCGALPDEGSADSVMQDIENGTVYSLADSSIMNNVRMERMDGSTLASGALLRNDWVLTAQHLFPADRLDHPETTLRVRYVDELLVPDQVYLAPGMDVALVHLSTGALINGSRTGFIRNLYASLPQTLLNQTLDCWGFGANAADGSGVGTLRRAPQKVVEWGLMWLGIQRNAQGQLMTEGDSGGVCFYGGEAVSVHHGRYSSNNRGHEEQSYGFRTWALNLMDRKPATVHRVALTCDGAPLGPEQTISLASGYSNYTCQSRYREQCIDDGSADSYYMEWCDKAAPQCSKGGSGRYYCDAGTKPSGSCTPTKVHRTVYSCNGDQLSPEQFISYIPGMTCTNNFVAQCVTDHTFDSYYSEWCEYTCR